MSDKDIRGLAYQRDDMLFDVYIGDKESLGMFKGVSKTRSERPTIPMFAAELRLCDAKRLMVSQGCRPRYMKFRFVDTGTRKDFYSKHPTPVERGDSNTTEQDNDNGKGEIFDLLARLKKVSDIVTNLPSPEKLADITGVPAIKFGDLTAPAASLKKMVDESLLRLTEAIRHQSIPGEGRL